MVATDIVKTQVFDEPAWELISPTGARAIVAERGATLVSWKPRPEIELISSYENAEELDAGVGGRGLIMAPWVGPIESGTYSFAGNDYRVDDAGRVAGLAFRQNFKRSSSGSTLSLRTAIPASRGYPWPIDVAVHFSLDSGAEAEEHLSLTLEVRNVSKEDAPLTIGWSPHVMLPGLGAVSNLAISVPSRTKILTNRHGIPLPGESAYAGVNMPMDIEYLGSAKLDDYYRGLVPDNYGVVATRVVDPASNSSIVLTQEPGEAPVVHVNTGDNLERAPRTAVALAPMSHVPDAFNRPDASGSIRVSPGQSRQMTATLTYRA
ncbi:aldose 1-epimerase [Trueperella bonasi]|uniref:Aldose 1-epimerase n=1 Tax=Trueperella bonasi TaxID=312286 RepID=A0ABT9NE63_9ACTO|nr:aldose 1-epimerase [Trueperella bonasi]MDP9805634.1 aldose 1-epimerase [Trueperella bonasi]